jgi:phosphonate transport system substrate-binding protein
MRKAQLSICPHDTARNLFGWYVLNTYLQRQLGEAIHFEPASSLLAERETVLGGEFNLVYANPYSALLYMARRGFVPVARVRDHHDEVVVVSAHGKNLLAEGRVRIASATDKLIVHLLGQSLLPGLGLDEERIDYVYTGGHPQAAQAVLKGEADLAFVFEETWRGLAASTRERLDMLGQSSDGTAFHCFCVGPDWSARVDQIRAILLHMNDDPKGKAILSDLGFGALQAIDGADLGPAARLLESAGLIAPAALALE